MSGRSVLIAAVLCLTEFGARADNPAIQFHSDLDGGHEVPAVQTGGTGKFDATFDRNSKALAYTINYQGLTGPAVAAHFHGPAKPGQNANVIVPIKPPLTSPIKGSVTLDDQQAKELMANDWYVNVHTQAHPNGEIRGQVLHGGP